MNTKCRKSVTALSTAGLLAIALSANAGDLYRIASDFAKFDGTDLRHFVFMILSFLKG